MGLKCGIVGLPNVGKSTLFNAITASQKAASANYPFCTIEPNVGVVEVPDKRLYDIAHIAKSKKILPATVEFVDIAGLVSGASKGEGLGNKFLSHIGEVDAIAHVLRCFDDTNITHVHGKVDPVYDVEIVETELILSDMQSIERRRAGLQKKARGNDKTSIETLETLDKIYKILEEGKPARVLYNDLHDKNIKQLNLLTTKPVFYICNVGEEHIISGNDHTRNVQQYIKDSQSSACLTVSSQIESEIALINESDRKEFLEDLGLKKSGLYRVVEAAYQILELQSYFTVGPKEARSWSFKKGISAPEAAGIIHSDFERGFICAEVIKSEDYLKYGGELVSKEMGKFRIEGKNYIVQDGDIIHFRFNV